MPIDSHFSLSHFYPMYNLYCCRVKTIASLKISKLTGLLSDSGLKVQASLQQAFSNHLIPLRVLRTHSGLGRVASVQP